MTDKKTNLVNFYEKMPKNLLTTSNNPHYDIHHIKVPFRMLIVGSSGSYKTGTLLNLINIMAGTWDKIVIITKNADEPLYRFLQTKIKGDQLEILEGIEKIPDLDKFNKADNNLVVFDDLMLDNLKYVAQYFIRARKRNVSCVFIAQSYFGNGDKEFKNIRRNVNYIILKKISGMRDLQLIMREYSLGLTKEEMVKLYEGTTGKSLQDFLMIDIDAPPEGRFRHNFDVIQDLPEFLK
jgi:hypothetical protein